MKQKIDKRIKEKWSALCRNNDCLWETGKVMRKSLETPQKKSTIWMKEKGKREGGNDAHFAEMRTMTRGEYSWKALKKRWKSNKMQTRVKRGGNTKKIPDGNVGTSPGKNESGSQMDEYRFLKMDVSVNARVFRDNRTMMPANELEKKSGRRIISAIIERRKNYCDLFGRNAIFQKKTLKSDVQTNAYLAFPSFGKHEV